MSGTESARNPSTGWLRNRHGENGDGVCACYRRSAEGCWSTRATRAADGDERDEGGEAARDIGAVCEVEMDDATMGLGLVAEGEGGWQREAVAGDVAMGARCSARAVDGRCRAGVLERSVSVSSQQRERAPSAKGGLVAVDEVVDEGSRAGRWGAGLAVVHPSRGVGDAAVWEWAAWAMWAGCVDCWGRGSDQWRGGDVYGARRGEDCMQTGAALREPLAGQQGSRPSVMMV